MIFTIVIAVTFFAVVTPSYSAALTDFSGNPKKISDYTGEGKWLVVMIWASDCHVCNQEAHEYIKFHTIHKDKDARMLGISIDGKEKLAEAKQFLKKHDINFPSLISEPAAMTETYEELTGDRFIGTPSFMVYKPSGELLGAQGGAVPTSVIESFIARESTSKQGDAATN